MTIRNPESGIKNCFVLTDIEGTAGVTSFEDDASRSGRYYDHCRRLATAEVNAAVEGLLDAGAEDVLVCDGHGHGGLWFEDLHPDARLLHGRPVTIEQLFKPLADYAACMIVGQHAMAGVPTSNMNHSQNSQTIDWIKLNGKPIGEIAQFALYAGSFGVPLIALTGERDACEEAKALVPGITTVEVKQGLGRGAAISLSAAEARRRIREGAHAAVQKHRADPVEPLAWDPPFVLEKRFFHTHSADAGEAQPGCERVDGQTVRFRGRAIRDVIYR
jgi:D-amino peptidase